MEELESVAGGLRNIYWRIRASRRATDRRRWYRLAQKEKARLAGLGMDQELIRLYCLFLADPHREKRLHRVHSYIKNSSQMAFEF